MMILFFLVVFDWSHVPGFIMDRTDPGNLLCIIAEKPHAQLHSCSIKRKPHPLVPFQLHKHQLDVEITQDLLYAVIDTNIGRTFLTLLDLRQTNFVWEMEAWPKWSSCSVKCSIP